LAERAGIKYKHYQAIEAGRKPKLQVPTLFKIAKGLEMEPWELLNFDTPPLMAQEDPESDRSRPVLASHSVPHPKRRPHRMKAP